MGINLTGKDKIKIKNDLDIDGKITLNGDIIVNGELSAEETTINCYRLNTETSVNVGTNLNVDEDINVSGDINVDGDIKVNNESIVKHLYMHKIIISASNDYSIYLNYLSQYATAYTLQTLPNFNRINATGYNSDGDTIVVRCTYDGNVIELDTIVINSGEDFTEQTIISVNDAVSQLI